MVPMGEVILYTSPEPKLQYQSIPNFERMMKLVEQRELPNFIAIDLTGAATHVGEIYSYRFSVFFSSNCFVNSPTYRNSQPMLTYGGSKDVIWRKNVPFGCPKCYN